MARRCVKCGYSWGWKLGDGRIKCRRCGTKYSWKSVWNYSRLPDGIKRRLLRDFAKGSLPSSQRGAVEVSHPSRERFYRFIRATLACQEMAPLSVHYKLPNDGGSVKNEQGPPAPLRIEGHTIALRILQQDGQFRIFPVNPTLLKKDFPYDIFHQKEGGLFFLTTFDAVASLRIRRGHVVFPHIASRSKPYDQIKGIEDFWIYVLSALSLHRRILVKFLPLYLSEIVFRFNHQHENLYEILFRLLQKTPAAAVQPWLRTV